MFKSPFLNAFAVLFIPYLPILALFLDTDTVTNLFVKLEVSWTPFLLFTFAFTCSFVQPEIFRAFFFALTCTTFFIKPEILWTFLFTNTITFIFVEGETV